MKKIVAILVLSLFFVSCNSPAPLEYYKRCVLNTVYVQHYGTAEILEILQTPPLKYDESKKNFDTVSYQQIIRGKIEYAKTLLQDVERLKVTTDAKDMVAASKDALNTAIKGEQQYYLQLAAMKDNKADSVEIRSNVFRLLENPEKAFQQKMDLLWGYGKIYADANGIDLSLEKKK
ncbi:MAG: hypothetical protein QM610_02550 [Chitinophagaceae bacterium]